MIEPLANYRDKFLNQRAIILASGPTTFHYPDALQFTDPVFFINDALLTIPEYRPNHYLFTMHQEIDRWWAADVTWLKWKHSRAQPRRGIEIDYVYDPSPRKPWQLDKDFCAATGHLCVRQGSPSGVLHFLWFAGCSSILGIGTNPASQTVKHDPRIGGQCLASLLPLIFQCHKEDLATFGISIEYHP